MLPRVLVALLLAGAPALAQEPPKTMQDAEAAYRTNDFAAAVSILRTLAEAGSAQAQHRLGIMIVEGRGTPRDPARAAEWIGKAAEQGETAAQYLFGRFLLEGVGVERNPAEAT
jgi:TPR repeat protein